MKRLILTLSFLMLISPANAGPGHDHGESAFAGSVGPVPYFELSDQQMSNLGIESAKVEFLPITQTVDMLAFTELLPEKRTRISPRFGGKILDIAVKVGQEVKTGQRLVTLEPVSVGNSNVVLSAPMDGFILNLYAGVGEIVEAGGDILEIGDATQMLVRGVAYETPDIASIAVDQKVEVHLDVNPDRHIEGKIQRINRVIDPESRTFSVYALVDTPSSDIQSGLQGTMEIFTGNDKPVLAVSKRSVLGELGSYFVYVIKGQEVEKRDVTLGAKTGHHIEIKSGLFPNERVVTNGNYQLQYISVGSIQDHDDNGHEETPHDEQKEHSHDDGHDHHDGQNHEGDSHAGHDHENEAHDHESHDDHSSHDH
ncbi:efflux RND transporter periplasmic adaptor subunit [Tunicatimonas pelagia]|uniref:efflux RND transporter periplasmic adaptor subunit n=1 Tax=Tunicatimonas pelagia TaxID=931531 RepID=UPI002665E567|nr:efflux RND transporter periplasmic adaptor subunit [Tunicatimonas pelagia]WKN45401.1 efflux RND transporter periplasmic adaptor subunit [Tunicatimonas pelagia]